MTLEHRVYKKLLEVPKGKVTTYSELAKAVGLKNGQRAIGRIMSNNPFPVIVPCHRVILSNGSIGGYMWGEKVKKNMLSREGVKIENGKILDSEAIHRWQDKDI
jgi:methylated-DNA-[protein]-cysteine S-methyltransferase